MAGVDFGNNTNFEYTKYENKDFTEYLVEKKLK
jgi:hypothetical protein